MAAKKRINLVFQGGGIRGVAHVGALKAIQSRTDIEVVGVGGSSVGSMIACLWAAGYDAKELETEMKRKPLHTLLGTPKKNIHQIPDDIKETREEIEAALERYKERFGTFKVIRKIPGLVEKIQKLKVIASDLFSDYGIYDTREILKWLQELLERKKIVTIEQLRTQGRSEIERFRLVVSDVTHSCYREITEVDRNEKIVDAVGKSISIPIFFKPFKVGESYYVDGGMLSNYPLWLFQDTDDATVGIRLRSSQDQRLSYPVDNFFDYILALLWTVVGAHDKFRRIPSDCYTLDIPTGEVGPTEFDLKEDRIDKLLKDAELCASKFDWDKVRPKRKIPFKEDNAEEILFEAMENASDIFYFSAGGRKYDVPRYELTMKIENDGTTVYKEEMEIKNMGETPIFHTLHLVSNIKVQLSFKDLRYEVEDITPAKTADQRVKYILYKNTSNEKGVVIFFIPPIEQGESRTRLVSYTIPEEFKTTLLRGEPEEGGFGLTAVAGNEVSFGKATYRILLHRHLGELHCKERNPGGEKITPDLADSIYREYRWEFSGVVSAREFSVELRIVS